MKKLISIALVVVMLLGMIPSTIFAKTYDNGQPVTESTTPATPVIDGIIGDSTFNWRTDHLAPLDPEAAKTDEYIWKTPAYSRETTTENEFIVGTKHTDTMALYSQFYVSYDEDYIYIAYRERNLSCSSWVWLDLNPRIGVGDEKGLVRIDFKMNTASFNAPIDLRELSVKAFTDGSNYTDASDILVDAKYSHTDDGARRVYMAELKISRDALANVYDDVVDMDAVGIRAFVGSDGGECFYADPTSTAKPFDGAFHASKGYHIFELAATDVETEPPVSESETEATEPETEVPALDLTAYGQKTYEVGKKTVTVDGTIGAGEYTNSPVTGWIDGAVDVTGAKLYFAYDENNLYIGGTATDTSTCDCQYPQYERALNVYIGGDRTDANNAWRIYLCKPNGTGVEHWNVVDGNQGSNLWAPTDKNFKLAQTYANGVFNYELSIDLDEWGITGDELFFAATATTHDSKADLFGFASEELDIPSLTYGIYPHVLKLVEGEPETEAPETEAPETEPAEPETPTVSSEAQLGEYGQKTYYVAGTDNSNTPNGVTVDGSIGEMEYNFVSKTTYTNNVSSNPAFCTVSGTDSVTGMDLYIAHDANNVYFGIKITDTAAHNNDFFYIDVAAGDKMSDKVELYVPRYGIGSAKISIETWVNGANITATANYVTEAVGSVTSDGYVYEVAISRAALAALANSKDGTSLADIDKIFYEGYLLIWDTATSSHKYNAAFGFTSNTLTGVAAAKNGVYSHVINLAAGTECDTCTDFVIFNDDCHKIICTVCGKVTVGAHEWSDDFTYNTETPSFGNAQYKIYPCTNSSCGATKTELVNMGHSASGETTYTLWQSNILQAYIQENSYTNNADGSYSYDILPSATNEMHAKGRSRYQNFYATLEEYMPDIVGLQECDLGWHVLLDVHNGVTWSDEVYGPNTVEDGYTFTYNEQSVTTYPIAKLGYASVFDTNDDVDIIGVRVPVYYNTAKFTVVESGIFTYNGENYYENPFSVTWAILKSLESGEYVAVTSTHVSAGNSNTAFGVQCAQMLLAKIQEIEAKYGVPVIAVGDYNAIIPEMAMQVYVNAGLKSGREDALERINLEYKTSGNAVGGRPGLSDAATTSQIDHCFYSATGIAGDIWDVRIDDTSYADHVPALFTFRIVGMDHECEFGEWEKYDQYTCRQYCACNEYNEDTHNVESVVPNNDGTHTGTCTNCGDEATELCTGDVVDNEDGTHTVSCDACDDVATAEHEYEYTSTGNTVTDTHTGVCKVCENNTGAVEHTFIGAVTDPTTPSTYGTMTYSCVCGAKWTETRATDSHFLRYQNHFFTGNALAVAPEADGTVSAAEYATKIEMYGNNKSAANQWIGSNTNKYIVTVAGTVNYFNIYMGFDADYIYLAGESILKGEYATATRNTSELIQFCLGGSEDISKNVKVRGTYNIANGSYTTNVWFYNADQLYSNGVVPAQTSDLANSVLADSNASFDADSNTLTMEFKISRAKLAEICGEDEKIGEIYFSGEATGVQVTDGVAKTGGSIWQALEFYTANQITPIAGQFYYLNGKFPHVLLLGTQEDYADYLADTAEHTGFYKACAGHTYAYVAAGGNTHKQVCTYCGAETEAVACTMPTDWTAVEGKGYHAKICSVCQYAVTEDHKVLEWNDNENGTHTGVCDACGGGEVTAGCEYGTWAKVDETNHGATCSACGNVKAAKHTVASNIAGTIGNKATLSADGTKSYTCETCNSTYTKSYSVDEGYYFLVNATGAGMTDVAKGAMKHFFLGNAMTVAPTLDGVIGAAEYGTEIYGPNKAQFTTAGWSQYEDGFNRFKTNCQAATKTDSATTYMAYDATNIYLAYAVHTDAATISNQQMLVYLTAGDIQKDSEQLYTLNGTVAGTSATNAGWSYKQTYVADADGVGGTMYYELVVNRETLVDKYDTTVNTADVSKLFYRSFIYCYNDAGASAGYILHCPTWDVPVINNVKPVSRYNHAIFLGTKASFADELTAGAAIFGATYDTTCNCSDDTFRLVMGETTHKEVCYKCGAERNEVAHEFSDWVIKDSAHEKTCTDCGYVMSAPHDTDSLTNNGANHTVACSVCGLSADVAHTYEYVSVPLDPAHTTGYEGHSIVHTGTCDCGATVTEDHNNMTITETTKTAIGSLIVNCDKCGYVWSKTLDPITTDTIVDGRWTKYITDGHFLWKENQRHLFLGEAMKVAPSADGVVVPGEYSWASSTITGTDAWAWNTTSNDKEVWLNGIANAVTSITLYTAYDNDNLYFAFTVAAPSGQARPATEYAEFIIGGAYELNKNIVVKLSTNGGLTGEYYYENKKDSTKAAAALACVVASNTTLDTATNTRVYEITVSRSALTEICGEETNLDKIYLKAAVTNFNASAATADAEFKVAHYTGAVAHMIGNQFYVNGDFPHVMFLGEKTEYKDYLQTADDDTLGDFYTECTSHTYRYVVAGEGTHKQVCSFCGAETTAENCTVTRWAENEGANTHSGACTVCSYVWTGDHDGEYTDHGDTHSVDCTICGATGAEAPHEFVDWAVDPDDNTKHKATCEHCPATSSVAHDFTDYVSNGDATCTEDGTKTAECDKNCGATDTVTDVGSATDHSFTNYVPNGDATCTEDGTKTAECNNGCGEFDTIADEGSATGHDYTDYVSNGDATCTEDGTKTAECNNGCGETDTVADEGSATGHDYTDYVSNGDATCTEDGTKTAECDNGCGETDTVEDVDSATGHSYTTYVSNGDATCTEDGTKTAECDNGCGETDTIADEGSATGHNVETWTARGSYHTGTCVTCGETITGDHNYVDKFCDVCGRKESSGAVVPTVCEHTWNDGEATKEATHTEEGEMTYTCTACGETKTEAIDKIADHEFGEWVSVDGNEHKRECACGETEKAAHAWNDGEVTKEPTTEEVGETTYTCADCSATKTEEIEKLEPTETEPAETEPAETEPAETEPAETEPAETEPAETEPAETEPTETEPAETEPSDNGCKSSAAAVSVVLAAVLGLCTVFAKKKED